MPGTDARWWSYRARVRIALGLAALLGGGLFTMLLANPITFVIDQARPGQPGRLLRSVTRKR